MSKIVIITGQTATGKTKKALEIASEINGELINCDSRQIYKKLDIITGKDIAERNYVLDRKINGFDVGYYTIKTQNPKQILNPKSQILKNRQLSNQQLNNQQRLNKNPVILVSERSERIQNLNKRFWTIMSGARMTSHISTPQLQSSERYQIPIWLYDIVDPKAYFSSYDYKMLALDVIADILRRGKTPIVVGGAGYYLYHLLYDIPTSGIPQNWELRKKLSSENIDELQKKFKLLDPAGFEKLNNSEKNNTQRLIRKIEILQYEKDHDRKSDPQISRESFLSCFNLTENSIKIHVLFEEDKEKLKTAIEHRVKDRMQMGAIDEIKKLILEGYGENDPGLRTIGYQQLMALVRSKLTLEQAEEEWIVKEMQYAKRQLTFMKKYIISAFWQHQEDF